MDVCHDGRNPVACALDGHEGSVDIGERALERSEVREGRCAHRRDGFALGPDGAQGVLAVLVGLAQDLVRFEQVLCDGLERSAFPVENVCPCDRHGSLSLRGAGGRAGFGDARHDFPDCLLVDVFGRLELSGCHLNVGGQVPQCGF